MNIPQDKLEHCMIAAKAKWQAIKVQHFQDVSAGYGELHSDEWWALRETWWMNGFMDGFADALRAAPREIGTE